jgi:hypothetical protein
MKNREIKFRAWDKKKKEMIYYDNDSHDELVFNLNSGEFLLWSDGGSYETKDLVLLQFTGLKDKNGKEIYEGDIIAYDGKGREIVEFENGCFWVNLGGELPVPLFAQMGIEFEVIGNIYENKDLLK